MIVATAIASWMSVSCVVAFALARAADAGDRRAPVVPERTPDVRAAA